MFYMADVFQCIPLAQCIKGSCDFDTATDLLVWGMLLQAKNCRLPDLGFGPNSFGSICWPTG